MGVNVPVRIIPFAWAIREDISTLYFSNLGMLTWSHSWVLSKDALKSLQQTLRGLHNLFIIRERHDSKFVSVVGFQNSVIIKSVEIVLILKLSAFIPLYRLSNKRICISHMGTANSGNP